MRVFKSLDGIPERVKFLGAVCSDLFDGRLVVNELSVLEDLNEDLFGRIVFEHLGLPCVLRIEDLIRLAVRDLLICDHDHVCKSLARSVVVESYDLLAAGICDLADTVGDLHLRNDRAVLSLYCSDLVYAAENRLSL